MTYARNERWHRGPRISYEEIEIRTTDDLTLRAEVEEPEELRATAVLAHAFLGRKSAFGRRDEPGIAQLLADKGVRTIAFDFRGHGDSSQPADWGYGDLMERDLPAVVAAARARADGKPVFVIGHALGGHVALVAQGTRRIDADAIVAIGVCDPSIGSGLVRRGVKTAALRVLGMGRTLSGDAVNALANVTVPVAAVLADRDRLLCPPRAGEALARRCRGPVSIFRAPVGPLDLLRHPVAIDAALSVLNASVHR
jgi:pimeloyl-ACP methyl ester carboxylesterase